MSNIPENVSNFGKILQSEMTLGDNGVITISEGAFEKTLEGTDLTLAQIKSVQDHLSNVVSGVTMAVGNIGLAEMAKNKDLTQVSAELKVHKDTISSTFKRSGQVPDGNGGMRTKYGVSSTRFQVNGASNKGVLKKVRAALEEEAKAILAG